MCTVLDSYNGTGLIHAADRGHVDIIRELLKTDIKIDHVNRLGWTALLEAIILGDGGPRHTEVVRLLVEAGANVNLADGQGVTALAHAQRREFSQMVAILKGAGARQGRVVHNPLSGANHDLQNHHRTVPHQIRRADPAHHPGRARGRAGRGRLQPLPAQGRGRAHRPADRLGHRRDVLAPVGGDDAGRRVVRRCALLLPLRGVRPGDHRPEARHPHAPGPRGRAHPVRHGGEAGRYRAEQHPLRHHPCQHRGRGRSPWTSPAPRAGSRSS